MTVDMAENREDVPVMLAIGERWQSPTEVHGDGGAGVLPLRAGARR